MKKAMLSTIDNPFNPFDNFDSWFMYDMDKGYNSCAYLARIGKFSDQLTDQENDEEQERAIDEIIKYDPLGIYIKVVKDIESEDSIVILDKTKYNL